MKVFLHPQFAKKERGEGGIRRVVDALHRWLPYYDVEIVDSVVKADLVNIHADDVDTDLPVALSLHGLYWSGYDWAQWCYAANRRLIGVAKRAHAVSTPSAWVSNALRRGMLLEPFTLLHGIEIDEWEAEQNEGYVFWGKTRPDPVCDPTPVQELALRAADVKFVSTFGSADLHNVSVVGKLTYAESQQYIRRAGVYLGTVRETGGITCLEAMASGVPVLGFDWGVNPEIVIHKETGYLVPPGDYDALAEGLAYCQEHRARLSTAAIAHVREYYQWKDRVREYVPFFEAALEAAAPRPVKVSIVVTAYNLDAYLEDCLNSLIDQTFQDWECIVVDDASPDRCGEIADVYASRDSRIRVIHNARNRYLAEARNVGLRTARGEYLISLDADDQLSRDALQLLVESLDKHRNIDVATGGFELVEPDGKHWQSGWPTKNPSFEEQIRGRNQVPYASLIRRWVWERTGGYRRRYKTAEDADFWTRAFSFGATPSKVTDKPTLIYSNRPGSMSRSEAMIDWTSWFTWAKVPELTPFGAAASTDVPFYGEHVNAYEPARISVVIPCGPGHDYYLQDALDSLVAQTFTAWEAIVVNDTGCSWFDEDGNLINPYLKGYPFVRIVEPLEGKNRGVSAARNSGIGAALTPLFVLFDADDYMQPLMLDVLYKAYKLYGGWIYTDWYKDDGEIQEAQDWSAVRLTEKMLGPSTGLYSKADWEQVGRVDETTDLWEDWSFQLSLLSHGICGTRVATPLFTYRYRTGERRENNFSRTEEALQYIVNKHNRLMTDEEFLMACGTCGGGGGQPSVVVSGGSAPLDTNMVLIEYVGPATQTMRVRSKVKSNVQYRYGGKPGSPERRFYAYAEDAAKLTGGRDFKQVPLAEAPVRVADVPTKLTAHTTERPVDDDSLSSLALPRELLTILNNAGLETIGQVKQRSLADLVSIKGMGPARARKVRDAVASHS